MRDTPQVLTIDKEQGRLLLKCPQCSTHYTGSHAKISLELRCAMLEQQIKLLKESFLQPPLLD